MGGQIDQQIHFRAIGCGSEMHRDLLANGFAVERGSSFVENLERHPGGTARGTPIFVFFEQLDNLRTAFIGPGFGVADRLAVGEHQRIGERVGADLGFVIIHWNAGHFFGRSLIGLRAQYIRKSQNEPSRRGRHGAILSQTAKSQTAGPGIMVSMKFVPLVLSAALVMYAQTAPGAKRPPVIDIHVHTLGGFPGAGPICPFNPQFLASDPKSTEGAMGWAKQDCTLQLEAAKTPDEYMKAMLAQYEELNVTAVVMGDPKEVQKWKSAAPAGRIITGTSFDAAMGGTKFVPLDDLRAAFTTGGIQVMGEVGLQYQGMSPSDMSVDSYFALAEQLDLPVGIHMGTGGSGRANIGTPKFRGSMGNPLLLEEVLARHLKLRLWIMHAGYPMIDNLLTLLQANSHVYVDVAGLIWSYPLKEVHGYIQRIVEAGFEDRVMFGTDQMIWPKLMAASIGVIEGATYLTPEQKRDILYNNAARFLRLK